MVGKLLTEKYCAQIHTPKETNDEINTKRYTFSLVSYVDAELKILKNLLIQN